MLHFLFKIISEQFWHFKLKKQKLFDKLMNQFILKMYLHLGEHTFTYQAKIRTCKD